VTLRRYLSILIRWWWLLLLGPLVAGVVGFLVTRTIPPTYRASTLVFVNQTATPNAVTYNDALLNQQLVKTYSRMAQQPDVLGQVIERLRLPMDTAALARHVTIQPVRETQLLEISAEGTDPAVVRDIANTIAEVFLELRTRHLPGSGGDSLWVAQSALLPVEPIGPRLLLSTALAALLGLLLAAAIVGLFEYLDDTVKSPEDLQQIAALATLGAVARFGPRKGDAPGVSPTRRDRISSEAYRLVRTNLEFVSPDSPLRSLLVTSAGPGEGKSTTAANLAIVLAQAGKRVILIDADLRKPVLHRLFGIANQQGLSNLLLSSVERLEGYLQPSGTPSLRLLPSGPLPPNPAELLSSARLPRLLEQLKGEADVIVIDSPPVLAVADPMVLASKVDGTLLVVDASRTRTQALRGAVEALAKSGTRLLGAVLNKLSKGSQGYGAYYDYSYQGHDTSSNAAPRQAEVGVGT
jgi:succinoglycan biosynthesis transport protein ExoP